MLFITSTEFTLEVAQVAKFGYIPNDGYQQGAGWSLSGSTFDDLRTNAWTAYDGELPITVTLTADDQISPAVPEASSLGWIGAGMLIGAMACRCRRANTTARVVFRRHYRRA